MEEDVPLSESKDCSGSAGGTDLQATISSIQLRLHEAAARQLRSDGNGMVSRDTGSSSPGPRPGDTRTFPSPRISPPMTQDLHLRDASIRQTITDALLLQSQNEELRQQLLDLRAVSDQAESMLMRVVAEYEETAAAVRACAENHQNLMGEMEEELEELKEERSSLLQGIAISDVAAEQQERHIRERQHDFDTRLELLSQEVAEGERLYTEALREQHPDEANDTICCGIAAEQRKALDLQSVYVEKSTENRRLEALLLEADEQRLQREIIDSRHLESLQVEVGVLLNENERLTHSLAVEEDTLRERQEHVQRLLGSEDEALRHVYVTVHEQLSREREAVEASREEAAYLKREVESLSSACEAKSKATRAEVLQVVLERCSLGIAEQRLRRDAAATQEKLTRLVASEQAEKQRRTVLLAESSQKLLEILSANVAISESYCVVEPSYLLEILREENSAMEEELAAVQRREDAEVEALQQLTEHLEVKLAAAAAEQAERDIRYGQKVHYLQRMIAAQSATNEELRQEQAAVRRTHEAVMVLRAENEALRLQIQGRIPQSLLGTAP